MKENIPINRNINIHELAEQEEAKVAHSSDSRIQGDIYPQELQQRQKYPHEQYTTIQRRRMNPLRSEQTSLRKRLMKRIRRDGKR